MFLVFVCVVDVPERSGMYSLALRYARLGSVGFGWVRLGSVGFGWVRLGSVGFGCDRLGSGGIGCGRVSSYGYGCDRKSSCVNSSHTVISYSVFCYNIHITDMICVGESMTAISQ